MASAASSNETPSNTSKSCIKFPPLASKCLGCRHLLIWTLGISLMVGFTVKDFLPLLIDYWHNNVATQVQVVVVDPNFRPPRILVGIPFYKFKNVENEDLMVITQHLMNGSVEICEPCQKLKNHSWAVWENMNLTFNGNAPEEAGYTALSLAFAKKFLTNFQSNQHLFDGNSSWNEPIFSSLLNLFIWRSQADFDQGLSDAGNVRNFWLYNGISENSSKFEPLFDHVLTALCQKMLFSESEFADEFDSSIPTNRTCTDLLLDRSAPVFFGLNGTWFALPAMETPKIRQYVFSFPYQEKNALWHLKNEGISETLSLYPDISANYMSSSDPIYTTAIFEAPNTVKPSGHLITARYSVHMRAIDKRPGRKTCHSETSVTVCFTKCTKMWIIEKCGCVPFAFKRGLDCDQRLPLCGMRDYDRCKAAPLPNVQRDRCLEKCKAACEYIAYSWQTSHQNYEPEAQNATEYNIKIIPSFSTFAEFTWIPKNSPEEFLSQTGGLLNFYLGVSGMSMFAFAIASIDFLRRWIRKKTGKNGQNRVGVENWQWAHATEIGSKNGWYSNDKDEIADKEVIVQFIRGEIDKKFKEGLEELQKLGTEGKMMRRRSFRL